MSETRSVETTGADIEEAIEAGLKQLEVARESVIVEIIEEPSRGILGLVGSKQARVRLTTAARKAPPPPQPRYELDDDDDDDDFDDFDDDDDDEDDAPYWQKQGTSPAIETLDADSYPIIAQAGVEKLGELLTLLEVEATVQVEHIQENNASDNTLVLHIKGDNLKNLIGRKGETLAALQYITRLMASRNMQQRADFVVDVDSYKANRADTLRRLAHRMANQAVERRRTVSLEPMPAHERRIIHMALRGRADVETRSVGEGNRRKVTIVPD